MTRRRHTIACPPVPRPRPVAASSRRPRAKGPGRPPSVSRMSGPNPTRTVSPARRPGGRTGRLHPSPSVPVVHRGGDDERTHPCPTCRPTASSCTTRPSAIRPTRHCCSSWGSARSSSTGRRSSASSWPSGDSTWCASTTATPACRPPGRSAACPRSGGEACNPARHIEIAGYRRPHAQVWTDDRVEHWERTGEHPPVAVWTAKQLAAFLEANVEDSRLHDLRHGAASSPTKPARI